MRGTDLARSCALSDRTVSVAAVGVRSANMLDASQIHVLTSLVHQLTAPTPTLADALDRYERTYLVLGELRPATIEWRSLACRRLRDWYGHLPITGSWREVAVEIGARLGEHESAASLACNTLARVLKLAHRWGMRHDGEHEIGRLARVRWNRRTRVLSQQEAAAFFTALTVLADTKRSTSCMEAIRLIAFSSLRASEACGLRWDEIVTADCRVLAILRKAKDGIQPVTISDLAACVIRRQSRAHEHVFPGRNPKRPITRRAVLHVCREAAELAGIQRVCLHTLRHTFATRAAEIGVPTRLASELLGHSSEWMTEQYQHVARADLREAADLIAAAMIVKEP